MDKALRIFIILLLVLSIGALVLEYLVFSQREELKGRNLMLVRGVIRLAETIEEPPGTNVDLTTRLDHVKLPEEAFKRFYKVDAAGKPEKDASGKRLTTGPGTLDSTLNDLIAKATLQFNRLNDTRSSLENTRNDLAQTKETLRVTEENLAAARKEIKEQADTIATQKSEIEQKTEQIATLEDEKSKLQEKNEQQTTQLAQLRDTLSDREAQIDAMKRHVDRLERENRQYRLGLSGGETNAPPPGLHGQILAVNPTWNFVVIDILPNSPLMPMAELVIQRGKQLIGKLRISDVIPERNFAIGEVLTDWQQLPVAKGDYVFY